MNAAEVQATWCATLVDEWVRAGIRHAVVSPGSRSTPLALALAERDELDLHVVLDERSAGFVALGIGKSTGVPAVLLCTSGTAAAGYVAAVVEAHHAGVPLLVCTADRPPELLHVGAPQTIDQHRLYEGVTRWSFDPGVADLSANGTWRSIAARAVLAAVDGPVHLNLPFREPLVAMAGRLPVGRRAGEPWHRASPAPDVATSERVEAVRGIVVAGEGAPDAVLDLGWPVLADPLSGLRRPGTIGAADAILRDETWAGDHTPDVIIHAGRPWASKVLGRWLAATDARHVLVDPDGHWADPDRTAALVVRSLPSVDPQPAAWLAAWSDAESKAQGAIDDVLAGHEEATEPAVARDLVLGLPDDVTLFVSSSMPIRDVEWFGPPGDGLRVLSNRGANGIDGITSTALGVALGSGPTVALLGDLAFLHDGGGLTGLAARGAPLVLVVIDNRGGGIFSFLPQATTLPTERFEQLFGTPQPVDLVTLAEAHGLPAVVVHDAAGVLPAVAGALGTGASALVIVETDRTANVAVHDELHRAVAAALR